MTRLAAVLAALALAVPARAQAPVPALTGPVVDRAGILSRSDAARLAQLAEGGRRANGGTGPQLQFLVVRSLEGEAIEDYSMRVAEAWKLGTAERDDGVLVVVAIEDRAVRIEVGGGVEGGLTDVQSSRIIRGTIVPAFREQRYGAGLYDAGVQILSALGSLPQGVTRTSPREGARIPLVAILGFIVLTSVLRGFLGFGRRRRGLLGWAGVLLGSGGFGGRGGGFGGGGGGGWSGGGGGFSGGGASGRW